MVAAISTLTLDSKTSPHHDNPPATSRPPLLPSERENAGGRAGPARRPRGREIPSRYMSPSTTTTTTTSSSSTSTSGSSTISSSSSASSISRRFPSPLVSRTNNPNNSTPKRSQSADRRRSATPKLPSTVASAAGEVPSSTASKLLVTSTRSLSVSFQGESFSFPISKTKAVVNATTAGNPRKATPDRRRSTPSRGSRGDLDLLDSSSKQLDQHQRWPARDRHAAAMTRSLDSSTATQGKGAFLESTMGMRTLHESLMDGSAARASFDGILNLDTMGNDFLGVINRSNDTNSGNDSCVQSDLTASDTDSVSSGSTSGAHDNNSFGGPRGIVSSARFWQETNMRLRRLQDPGSISAVSASPRSAGLKPLNSRKFSDGPIVSPRAMSSPIRGAARPASPSQLMATPLPMRGISPSKMRSSISRSLSCNLYDTPSVLSYVVDVRRGKVGENRIIDAHQLRLLYNRHLQWRFVNARAEAALLVQKQSVEKNLWNAWITITGLRDAVRQRRAQLQLLKQKLKLSSILKGQIAYMEEWSLMEEEHCSSLQGAIEALKASTLRLPVVGGVIVDIRSVKEAVGSAVEVMQTMVSSMCSILTKVEEVNGMVAELANLGAKETALLGQCKDVLSTWASLEVKDCSLRTHIMQINRLPIA